MQFKILEPSDHHLRITSLSVAILQVNCS